MLIDVNSYIKDSALNIGYGHRTFRARAEHVANWDDSQASCADEDDADRASRRGPGHCGFRVDVGRGFERADAARDGFFADLAPERRELAPDDVREDPEDVAARKGPGTGNSPG